MGGMLICLSSLPLDSGEGCAEYMFSFLFGNRVFGTDNLPDSMQATVRQAMNQAYRIGNVKKAKKLLNNLAAKIEDQHPGAAESLREGLDETLTVMGLGIPA